MTAAQFIRAAIVRPSSLPLSFFLSLLLSLFAPRLSELVYTGQLYFYPRNFDINAFPYGARSFTAATGIAKVPRSTVRT